MLNIEVAAPLIIQKSLFPVRPSHPGGLVRYSFRPRPGKKRQLTVLSPLYFQTTLRIFDLLLNRYAKH